MIKRKQIQIISKVSACKFGGGEERQEGDSGLEEGRLQVGGASQENLSHRTEIPYSVLLWI